MRRTEQRQLQKRDLMQLHVMRSAQELSDLGNTYKKRLHPVTVTPRVTKTLIKVINK
jgi:hypothetical protein